MARAVCVMTLASMLIAGEVAAQQVTSFESEDWTERFQPGSVTAERVREHATDGEWALRVLFPGAEEDTWPGVSLFPQVDTSQKQVLMFDVFNPAEEPVRLSWRLDLADESTQFGGTGVQPGASTVELWVSGLGPLTRIYLYIRMPRADHVLFFDNFRWATVEDRFRPLVYVDDAEPPEPTDMERVRGFILFSRPLTDVVFATSPPRDRERIDSVDVFATPGEYEPATLAIFALEDLTGLEVRFEGVPATGEVLPVRCLNKRVTYKSEEYLRDMPVLCERREAVDVAAGASRRFVIDLHIDENAPAGIHRGSVIISRAGAEPVTLPMRLRVLPYRLAEPADMFWGEYYTGPKLVEGEEEALAQMRRDLADQRAHGMSSLGLTFGLPTDNVTWGEDGSCEIALEGTRYAAFMDMYVELGFPMPVILLSDSGQAAAGMAGDFGVDSEQWAAHYQAFWRTMQAEHRRRGWPEVIVQPVDEPGWQSRERQLRNVRCLRLLKQIPGMRTEQDGPGDEYFHTEAGPWADVWNYNGGIAEREVVEEAQDAGRIVTVYNCDVESYRPEVDRYAAGWFQVAAGINGCYNWAYMSWNGSPYDDLDHATGSWMHVYPPMGQEPGGPSTGWIGAREGVDDYRYVHTLRQAIRRAEAAGGEARAAAREARRELDGIVAGIDYNPRIRGTARWTQTGALPDGTETIGGTLKLPNGWRHADYLVNRWLVAQATMRVLEALGEIPQQ
ncbi:MAG: glycoside hydrolase domain-containing protein [Armatimonadota bacterium]